MSRVDVIVPCYNYGRYLRACVASVLAQAEVNVRILIIDDCSTDDSEAVGRRLAAESSQVEYRRHPKNQGHIATYNEGLRWITGDYCLLLSADDLLVQGALARAVNLMDQNPQVGMAYGNVIRSATPDFWAVPPPSAYDCEVIPGPAFIEASCRACTTGVETATAVVRTLVQQAVGGYRPELPHAGDQEMWLRCASQGAVGRIHAPQAFYRRHGANMSDGYESRQDVEQVRAAFRYFFSEYADRVPGFRRHETLVNKGLAVKTLYLANDAFDLGDLQSCRRYLAEAVSLDPTIRSHKAWRRLRLKQSLGVHLCQVLRLLLRRSRSAVSTTA